MATTAVKAATDRRPHPLDALADPIMTFDLDAEIERLHGEADWRTGQNAKTLAKYDDLRIVLTALASGRRMPGHKTDGRISIQTVQGLLRVHTAAQTFDLPAGRLLVLDRGIPHDVEALSDSAFLLTIARPPSRQFGGR